MDDNAARCVPQPRDAAPRLPVGPGVAEFPEDGALQSFLAMALFNTEQHHKAMQILLRLIATTSQDAYVQRHRRAIEHYAQDLDKTV